MSRKTVVICFAPSGAALYAHEKAALSTVADSIARITRWDFSGCFDPAAHAKRKCFFVPSDTLLAHEAAELGISSAADVFGGVVAHPLLKTKAITHELPTASSPCPGEWQSAFPNRVRPVVLPGYTAFDADDARAAARRLFVRGPVRLKDALGDGGHGQTVVRTPDELDRFLENYPGSRLSAHGLVLEANLADAVTRSVGQISVGDLTLAYHGTQRTVANNAGLPVYGGSALVCVRGGWEALEDLPMRPRVRLAITQARTYDQATAECPGFFASRRNYDVCQGVDGAGHWRSGVLESSWRSGGASTVEMAALAEFARDPALQIVEAASVKEFGGAVEPPRGAIVHFQGDDPEEGPLLRYTVVHRQLRQAA